MRLCATLMIAVTLLALEGCASDVPCDPAATDWLVFGRDQRGEPVPLVTVHPASGEIELGEHQPVRASVEEPVQHPVMVPPREALGDEEREQREP